MFGDGYSPGNAGGNTYGTVTLREALSRSLNVATVDLADLIGVERRARLCRAVWPDAQPDGTRAFRWRWVP